MRFPLYSLLSLSIEILLKEINMVMIVRAMTTEANFVITTRIMAIMYINVTVHVPGQETGIGPHRGKSSEPSFLSFFLIPLLSWRFVNFVSGL